jgi:hypothetical protein
MWVQKNKQVRVIAIGLNDRAQNRKCMWVQKWGGDIISNKQAKVFFLLKLSKSNSR